MTDALPESPTEAIPEHDANAHDLVGEEVEPDHELDTADFVEGDYEATEVDLPEGLS